MRLRMYLRGLGIGVVVTALLMGFSSNKQQTLTDEEIKTKAAALGMVEEASVLKPVITEESAPKEEPAAEEPVVEEPVAEEPAAEEPVAEEPAVEEPVAEEPVEEKPVKEEPVKEEPVEEKPVAEEPVVEEPKAETVKTEGTFTIEIAGGSGSETVCALLEKGGAIASAVDFDKYLCDHGYDHKIRAGKHVIPAGSDYEAIAKIITGR